MTRTHPPEIAMVIQMFRFDQFDIRDDPFPHVLTDSALPEPLFKSLEMSFPDRKIFPESVVCGGRTDLSFAQFGSSPFDEFVKTSDAWLELFEFVKSPQSYDMVVKLFGDRIVRHGARVEELGLPDFSLSIASDGYHVLPHHDRRYHVAQILLFFGDASIEDGGDLVLYSSLPGRSVVSNRPDPCELVAHTQIRPKRNCAVLWLNTPNSYHGTTALRGQRRFLYIAFNVKGDTAWPLSGQEQKIDGDSASPYRSEHPYLAVTRPTAS